MHHLLYKFGKQSEVEFSTRTFRGKAAGKFSKYSRFVDNIIQVRIVIFAMIFNSLFPLVIAILEKVPNLDLLILQQVFLALLFLIAGLLYNRLRIIATLIAIAPLILTSIILMSQTGQNVIRPVSFQFGIFMFVSFGLVRHFQMKKIHKQLSKNEVDT